MKNCLVEPQNLIAKFCGLNKYRYLKKKEIFILLLTMLVSVVSSCGKSPDTSQNVNNTGEQTQKQKEEEAICSSKSPQQGEVLFSKNISITREFQRTIRYLCDGSVKSDEMETVVSPHGGDLIISPKVAQENKRTNYKGHWKIINRSLCSGRTSYRFNDPDMYEAVLFLDMSPGFFSFQVAAGENNIGYEFYACGKVDENGYCLEKGIQEMGTVIVNVDYKENTRPGTREFHPSEDECKPKPVNK